MFYVDKAKCTGCGTCIQVCSQGAISFKEDKAVIAQWLCVECGSCLMACPADAIDQIKRPVTAHPRTVPDAVPAGRVSNLMRDRFLTAPTGLAPTELGVIPTFRRKWLSLGRFWSTKTDARLRRGAGQCRRRRGRRR